MNIQYLSANDNFGDFMISVIIRTFLIYCIVTLCVRLMGKRQLGQLQPGELVITILISEIAAKPVVDSTTPLMESVLPLFLLVSFEIINSLINMKSVKFRLVTDGNPKTIITNGEVDQKELKNLRLTINDVTAALRQKDIFNIEDVEYAVVETNGTLSVLLKPNKRNATPDSVKTPDKDNGMPCPVVIDGKIIKENFLDTGVSISEIERKIERERLKKEDILLMTVDKNKSYYIIMKKG